MHELANIHILRSLLWDCVHTAVCEKSLVRIEESVLLQVVCTGPLTCVAHFELHKKKTKKKPFDVHSCLFCAITSKEEDMISSRAA